MIRKLEDLYRRSQVFWENHRARRLFRFGLILIWLVLIGIAVWLGWKNQAVISQYFANARPDQLITSLAYYFLSLSFAAASWVAIVYRFSPEVTVQQHLLIYLLTLASRRLPGTLWYIGGRAVLYKKMGVSTSSITLASGIELITSILTGLSLGAIWMAAQGMISIHYIAATVGALLGIGGIFGIAIYRFVDNPPGYPQGAVRTQWLQPFLVVFLLDGMWISGGLMAAEMVQVFLPLSANETLRVAGFWAFSGGLGLITFILPSSFGVTELTFTGLLVQLAPLPVATTIAILTRVGTTIFEVVLAGLVSLAYKLTKAPKVESD